MQITEEWLGISAQIVSIVIEAMAVLVIALGSIEALWRGLRAMCLSSVSSEKRVIWLHFSRWLIAGLTFQLASDMVRTAVAPSWDAIGRLAAIAAIRGGLSLLLELEVARGSREPSEL